MKCLLPLLLLSASLAFAEDIITLNGTEYKDVTNVKVSPDGLSWMTDTGVMKVKFTDLPEDVRQRYGYDPYEASLTNARGNTPSRLTLSSAFRLSQLEEAKKKAVEANKPLGFVMVWDQYFNESGSPMGQGSVNALAHFYQVFNDNVGLIFVRHEDELDKVPGPVQQGFRGPDEGGFAPNMCVVSPDASEFICEIPMVVPGTQGSTGAIREKIFRDKIKIIKEYQAAPPATPAP